MNQCRFGNKENLNSRPYQVSYPVFRIRIRLDPDSNRQSGSGFGIRIRIQQLKWSFFKAVEGCTERVGTSKHLFAGGGGQGCEVCVFVCLSSYQLAVMCFLIIHMEIWQPFCSANSKIQVNKYHTGRNPQIFLNCLSKWFFFTWIRIRIRIEKKTMDPDPDP